MGSNARGAFALAVAVGVASGCVHGLTVKSPGVGAISAASPWHWYLGRIIIVHGPSTLALLVPAAVTAVLGGAGIVAFNRRDLR